MNHANRELARLYQEREGTRPSAYQPPVANLLIQIGDAEPVEVTTFQPKPSGLRMANGVQLYVYPDRDDMLALRVNSALAVAVEESIDPPTGSERVR